MHKKMAIYVLLAILCVIIYWPAVKYPYVQDDWQVLSVVLPGGGPVFPVANLLPEGQLLYRPLPWIYFVLVARLFGTNAVGHHVISLFLHVCTSLLVLCVVRKLVRREPVASLAAVMYLAAVSIHMDPLLWLVGMYDLGAAFFFFLSLALFLKGNDLSSAASFGGGLLCKEAVLPLPAVLVLVLLSSGAGSRQVMARRLWPHLLVVGLYAVLRGSASTPLLVPSAGPYAVNFSVALAAGNMWMYLRWLAEATTPFLKSAQAMNLVLLTLGGLLAVRGGSVLLNRSSRRTARLLRPDFLFWPGWMIAGILPVLFLSDHPYRYYLTYSLLPAIIIVLWIIGQIGRLFGVPQRYQGVALVSYTIVTVVFSAAFLRSQDADGWRERPLPGTNGLIGKASEVALVRDFLLDNRVRFGPGSVLLFDGLDGRLFGGSLGPRVWLSDSTVVAVPSSWATWEGDSVVIQEGSGQRIRVAGSGVRRLVAEMEGGNLTGRILNRGATLSP